MINVVSYIDFLTNAVGKNFIILLLYNPRSEENMVAYETLRQYDSGRHKCNVYVANVSIVKDIPWIYDVDEFPVLLIFRDGKFDKAVKGFSDSLLHSFIEPLPSFINEINFEIKKNRSRKRNITVNSEKT